MVRIAILGAGISGLAVAWKLQHYLGPLADLILIEKSDRSGGSIRTIREGDFLFEQGPRGCRPKGAGGLAALQLVEELGLQEEVIIDRGGGKRYLWYDGSLHQIPIHPFLLLFSHLGISCWRELWQPKGTAEDESVAAFFLRRFGPLVVERYVDPMISGIWAGDPHRLSIKACFPELHQWEQTHGSVVRGALFSKPPAASHSPFVLKKQACSLFSFKQGMGQLIDTLQQKLQGKILFSQEVKRIGAEQKAICLEMQDGTVRVVDRLILALPAYALIPLLPELPELRQIEAVSVVVINCGYRRSVLKSSGFGYLIPFNQKQQVLGAVWDSSIFPTQNKTKEETRITVMMGGARHPEMTAYSPQDCLDIARRALSDHLGIKDSPDGWSYRLAQRAIPQYCLGYQKLMTSLHHRLSATYPGVSLLGHNFNGISVNECILQADLLAKKLGQIYSGRGCAEKEKC